MSSTGSRNTPRDLALIAVFAGIVAALGIVPGIYPLGIPVPITAQSLGVMLAGAVLGARRGALSLLLFLALAAVGLPVLAGGRGGLGQFAGPSVGFLVGFPVAAFVIGWLTERGGPSYKLVWGLVANIVGGIVVLYVLGIAGMALVLHLSVVAAAMTCGWFVLGDLAKAVVAAAVARGVHAAYPGLLDRRAEASEHEPAPA